VKRWKDFVTKNDKILVSLRTTSPALTATPAASTTPGTKKQ
jgi:hypothetical protein